MPVAQALRYVGYMHKQSVWVVIGLTSKVGSISKSVDHAAIGQYDVDGSFTDEVHFGTESAILNDHIVGSKDFKF